MAQNAKTVLIPIVVVVVAAGIAYAAGRWQGHEQTAAVQKTLDQTRTDLTTKLTNTKGQLSQCRTATDQLEARRQIYMALEELQSLNFGYAQQHVKSAGNILANAADGNADLEKLSKDLEAVQIQPSGQLDQQRQVLRNLAARFDKILPPAKK